MMLPDPIEFRMWQVDHYTNRLAQATRTEEKAFLRKELYNLKKSPPDENDSNDSDHYDPGVRSHHVSLLALQTYMGCQK